MVAKGSRDMVKDDAEHLSGRRTSAQPYQRRVKKRARPGNAPPAVTSPSDRSPPDLEAVRKARLEYIDKPAEDRQKMRYVGETVTKEHQTRADAQSVRKVVGHKSRRQASDPDRIQSTRRVRTAAPEAREYESVYERHEPTTRTVSGRDHRSQSEDEYTDSESHDEESREGARHGRPHASRAGHSRRVSGKSSTSRTQMPAPARRQSEPVNLLGPFRHNSDEVPLSSGKISRDVPDRTKVNHSRPSLHRSATTKRPISSAQPSAKPRVIRQTTAPSTAQSQGKKTSSIFSGLLKRTSTTPPIIKKVSCLTCGEDDVPIMKTAKLACTHRMCHQCLRRIFTMSVTDPAHMPPKCCTSKHIPLGHVDKLFDQKFKKVWNRKFQEYSTRNRIYCPNRRCGEWIKPNHIFMEHGRKVGICKKCSTRVCCTCNNKMHTSRDCPNDPATKEFVEYAQQEGWKRCYSCSAMVELKEGCNHMTCRCTAEFCMICGNKWKTCDCPWFTYEAVAADRLLHVNTGVRQPEDPRAPIRYQEEMDQRRNQELDDEAFARRLETLGGEDDGLGDGPGGYFGIGNARPHFLNEDFRNRARNILTGNFRQAAREAEGLLNGLVTGRENPLPPSPLELNDPATNPANQTAQLLRPDNAANAGMGQARRRRSHDPAGAGPRDTARRRPPEVPLPPAVPNPARDSGHAPARRASVLADLLTIGGRSQMATGRRPDQRIENWRHEIPPGEPADESSSQGSRHV